MFFSDLITLQGAKIKTFTRYAVAKNKFGGKENHGGVLYENISSHENWIECLDHKEKKTILVFLFL